jgi:hypothetical protein
MKPKPTGPARVNRSAHDRFPPNSADIRAPRVRESKDRGGKSDDEISVPSHVDRW